ncbi:MAG: ABC transporter ATP-binding protein [Anaerolineales bacterium]|nr:ABC transporter ATP-binding protein [Anaerolineales bacterium]MCZ2122869.1 ABC transporter ATP-binding protein [Anaerolineales bacterium]
MNNLAIRVENVGKQYKLGGKKTSYRTFREAILNSLTGPVRWLKGKQQPVETFWALRDVSFEINHGDAVGIIGRNGAGKSTLLKLLSRITNPTKGRIELYGRVASLLEVGTGFHPELSGRDNIYLNGAILGMSRLEIGRKFDEIVDFAEVEKFLDTPVKHYSSGMYVRLAFAVAAHLEPEILVVDEVLAVGDAEFQKKCLGKMDDVAKSGRTVLFVSHNMGAITQLCQNVILLNKGTLETFAKASDVVQQYLSSGGDTPDVSFDLSLKPNSAALIARVWLGGANGEPIPAADVNQSFAIGLELLVRRKISNAEISMRISNTLGQPLFTTNLSDESGTEKEFQAGNYKYLINIPMHFLAPDTYSINIAIHEPFVEVLDQHEQAMSFEIKETGSRMWRYNKLGYGNILVDFPWKEIS